MVVFLTSVRHPHNSNQYPRVIELLEMSLRSVCAQTSHDFRVVVVCNEQPDLAFHDPRIVYHVVDFPPASASAGTIAHEPIVKRDKGTKKLSGLLLARQFTPDYIFMFDADDLVSRRVAAFANERPGETGWYVDAGYVLNLATGRIQRKHGLVRYCGTTLMPSAAALYEFGKLETQVDERSSQQELLSRVDPVFIAEIVGGHAEMVGYFAERGRRMRPLPFRATAWVQETGENVVAARGTDVGVPATPAFCEEFGVRLATRDARPASALDYLREMAACARSKLGALRGAGA